MEQEFYDWYDYGFRVGTFERCNGIAKRELDHWVTRWDLGFDIGYNDAYNTNKERI